MCVDRASSSASSSFVTGTPSSRRPDEATFVVDRMRERGVLVGTDGPYHNVIKIRGPMPLSLADADQVVDTLARALRELPSRR